MVKDKIASVIAECPIVAISVMDATVSHSIKISFRYRCQAANANANANGSWRAPFYYQLLWTFPTRQCYSIG